MSGEMSASRLDGRGARLAAIVIAASAAALLAYLNRGLFLPSEDAASSQDAVFAGCMAEREAGIAEMVRQQVITSEQETLFRSRAEALCRAQGAPAGAPPPPGLPPPQ